MQQWQNNVKEAQGGITCYSKKLTNLDVISKMRAGYVESKPNSKIPRNNTKPWNLILITIFSLEIKYYFKKKRRN